MICSRGKCSTSSLGTEWPQLWATSQTSPPEDSLSFPSLELMSSECYLFASIILIKQWSRPQKGSVVLWWNMDKNGGYDDLVKHGGCPVLIGSKWITNKWVRINSQMYRRPCPRYSNREIREFRENGKFQRGGFYTEPWIGKFSSYNSFRRLWFVYVAIKNTV